MKELDFLPARYHRQFCSWQRTKSNTLYSIALLIALGCLHFTNASQLRRARAAILEYDSKDAARTLQENRMASLRARKHVLLEDHRLLDQLDDDAPLHLLISEITHSLGDNMSLTKLTIESPNTQKTSPKSSSPLGETGITEACLVGLAHHDIEVGIYLERMAHSEFFHDVKMGFSRQVTVQDHSLREFQFDLTVTRVQPDK